MSQGLSAFYSVRDKNSVPQYTIELDLMFTGESADGIPRETWVVKQVKGLKNKRPRLAKDCVKILAFLDHMGIATDGVDDLEHCLKRRPVPTMAQNRRRTSRRRTSRRAA